MENVYFNMRRKTSKLVATLMVCLVVLSVIPFNTLSVFAISCRKDSFNKNYTLSGNMAEDVVTIAKAQEGRTGSQFGYTEAWCDEFVADCIENSGADSSIVGHGGTVADFESVMRGKGAVEVTSPQVGDLVFFTFSHVEIVSKVVDGVPYSVGGNNGSTGSYKTNYCRAEHKVSSTGSVRLYLRPNYTVIISPPSDFTCNVDKTYYAVGETVTFSFSSKNTAELYIPIDVNGTRKYFIDVTGKSTYSCSFDEPGLYAYCVYGKNSCGECNCEYKTFYVYSNVIGNVNLDDKFNISDAVLLQKYLLNTYTFTKEQWELADMTGDGEVNVFDLCVMKNKLINS